MASKAKVLARFPAAMLAHVTNDSFEIVVPSTKPSAGWKAHRMIGRGGSPRAAWISALAGIVCSSQQRRDEHG